MVRLTISTGVVSLVGSASVTLTPSAERAISSLTRRRQRMEPHTRRAVAGAASTRRVRIERAALIQVWLVFVAEDLIDEMTGLTAPSPRLTPR